MREFRLASSSASVNVDLWDFEELIISTVTTVIPKAKVKVYKDRYTIDDVSKGESISIGKILAKTMMGHYCIQLSKLFCGTEIDETEESDG